MRRTSGARPKASNGSSSTSTPRRPPRTTATRSVRPLCEMLTSTPGEREQPRLATRRGHLEPRPLDAEAGRDEVAHPSAGGRAAAPQLVGPFGARWRAAADRRRPTMGSGPPHSPMTPEHAGGRRRFEPSRRLPRRCRAGHAGDEPFGDAAGEGADRGVVPDDRRIDVECVGVLDVAAEREGVDGVQPELGERRVRRERRGVDLAVRHYAADQPGLDRCGAPCSWCSWSLLPSRPPVAANRLGSRGRSGRLVRPGLRRTP